RSQIDSHLQQLKEQVDNVDVSSDKPLKNIRKKSITVDTDNSDSSSILDSDNKKNTSRPNSRQSKKSANSEHNKTDKKSLTSKGGVSSYSKRIYKRSNGITIVT
ncbi:MAG: hypothetical protein Gaeavirus25_1, partial [Gaeavirus sp.]